MNLILFDIDSTLLHDGGASGAAFERAFEEIFSVVPEKVAKYGRTDPSIARETALITIGRELTEDELSRLNERYINLLPIYLKESKKFRIFDGVFELCETLKMNNSNFIGLQTGNLEVCAWEKLKKAGLDKYFHFGGFGSDSPDRTELVRIAVERGLSASGKTADFVNVFVVGDSPFDIAAGNLNGAFTIGVTTGRNSADELADANASVVVNSLTKESGIYKVFNLL
jgi:phosphoglycolate phosphatase-like HAD superfamily hydrolase